MTLRIKVISIRLQESEDNSNLNGLTLQLKAKKPATTTIYSIPLNPEVDPKEIILMSHRSSLTSVVTNQMGEDMGEEVVEGCDMVEKAKDGKEIYEKKLSFPFKEQNSQKIVEVVLNYKYDKFKNIEGEFWRFLNFKSGESAITETTHQGEGKNESTYNSEMEVKKLKIQKEENDVQKKEEEVREEEEEESEKQNKEKINKQEKIQKEQEEVPEEQQKNKNERRISGKQRWNEVLSEKSSFLASQYSQSEKPIQKYVQGKQEKEETKEKFQSLCEEKTGQTVNKQAIQKRGVQFYKGPCKSKNLFSCMDASVDEEEIVWIQPKYR